MSDKHWASRAVHDGRIRSSEHEHAEALFLTSSFVFDSAEHAEQVFAHTSPGNIYSRFSNPTVNMFEARLASLEGAERCVATSSGMAAILSLVMSLLKAGDHVVLSRHVFGSIILLFENILARFGVETTQVDLTDFDAWERAIQPNTALLFLETPSNPLTRIADIAKLAELAHQHHALLAVDNVYCTPALQQPLSLGADIVVHSATKYIDGQGRAVGGAVLGGDVLMDKVYAFMRTAGPALSPFNAWLFLKGLETLELRMQRHCDNAMQLALWLQQQSSVREVYYPGLPDHPQHAIACMQQQGFGGIVAFELSGGRDAAWKLIDRVEMMGITANVGDTRSIITHPATTTHGRLTPEQREQAGIRDGLVRISVGIEDIADIIGDLRM
jgi:O-succinylhomoserine sulfhydrylase